jgi:bifunctional non-homologous end joining protein LigD
MPTLVEESLDTTTLYYREGSSDKIYQCAIEPAGTRFVVNFAFGRRGSTLHTGTKTNVPVDYDAAKRIYDKLVKEKTAKGYTPGPDGTPYHNSPKEDRFTGLLPQLLNPIDEVEMNRLLTNDNFGMQEKFDGRRLLIQK